MTTVNSYKPMEQAIKDGEETVKVETPKLLVACAVAEKCGGIPDRIKSFLDLLLKRQGRDADGYSELYYPIVGDKGRVFRIRLNISLCADALKVMGLLKQYGPGLQVCRNEEGAMTGEMKILRADP